MSDPQNLSQSNSDDDADSAPASAPAPSTKSRAKTLLLGAVAAVVVFVLALPLSNYFLVREKIDVNANDAGFVEVSKIMQQSCADCHSPGLTAYPIYGQWPIAKDTIARDIAGGQDVFRLSKSQLSGAEPLSTMDLAKVATVVDSGSMPPPKYLMLHWNAVLTPSKRQAILAYIQERQDDSGRALAAIPTNNPFQPDAKKVALGEKLFSDKRLSVDNTVSCASCHNLSTGGSDHEILSSGIKGQKSPVNTPTIFNAAFNSSQFWDGRTADLAEQVSEQIVNPEEMGSSFSQALAKLKGDTTYGALSEAAYGAPLDQDKIKDAIVAYEKTLITPNSAFDRYLGGDENALDAEQKRGYQLFMEKGCASCHSGAAMGGLSFEKMGKARDYFAYRVNVLKMPMTAADNGRFNVTKSPLDKGKFKVPLLRNVALTAPYFHDGSAKTLGEAVDIMGEYECGSKLSKDEISAIVSFLKSLTGELHGKKL